MMLRCKWNRFDIMLATTQSSCGGLRWIGMLLRNPANASASDVLSAQDLSGVNAYGRASCTAHSVSWQHPARFGNCFLWLATTRDGRSFRWRTSPGVFDCVSCGHVFRSYRRVVSCSDAYI